MSSGIDWLSIYHIQECMDILKAKSPEWHHNRETKIKRMSQIKSKDQEVRDAWKRVFKFRREMEKYEKHDVNKPPVKQDPKVVEIKMVDDKVKAIIETFRKYSCTQTEVAKLTGIPKGKVRKICSEVPEAFDAFVKAKNIRRSRTRKQRSRARG